VIIMANEYLDQEMKKWKNKTPTKTVKIEGIGTGKLYGELDAEKLIKRLLESKAITER
jgi:hypothetical protein